MIKKTILLFVLLSGIAFGSGNVEISDGKLKIITADAVNEMVLSRDNTQSFINWTIPGGDNTLFLTGGPVNLVSLIGVGSISGSDLDISAGTGDYTSTGIMSSSTITDGAGFTATGGVVTSGVWNGTPIDISDYTNLAVDTDHLKLTDDTLSLSDNEKTLSHNRQGSFLEQIDFTISESSGTVTGSLEKEGTGDLTQFWSDDFDILDCTGPVCTVDLTAFVGPDTSPVASFVYILQSAKNTLVVNSSWPANSVEHIRVCSIVLQSATTTGTEGALMVRNWNDNSFGITNPRGGTIVSNERLRKEHALWDSGVILSVTGSGTGTVTLDTTSGAVYQLNLQAFPAIDTAGADNIHLVNLSGSEYSTTTNLVAGITTLADGVTSLGNNKYFNIVVWGVQNRTGTTSHLMCNLPIGQYNNSLSGTTDPQKFSVHTIPSPFRGTGFLIAELTFQLTGGGSTWTLIQNADLLGQIPTLIPGGGTTTAISIFSDASFEIFDNGDDSKEIRFEASAISPGEIRIITMADVNVDLADIATNATAIGLNTTHRSSDGSDHTFLDQSVISGATPTFTGTNITGVPAANILAGTFGTGAYVFDNTLTVDDDLTAGAGSFVVDTAGSITLAPASGIIDSIGDMDVTGNVRAEGRFFQSGKQGVQGGIFQAQANATNTGGQLQLFIDDSADTETTHWHWGQIFNSATGDLGFEARGGTGGNRRLYRVDGDSVNDFHFLTQVNFGDGSGSDYTAMSLTGTITQFGAAVANLNETTITGDLTVDIDSLVVDTTNGRVGIKTASPLTEAEVAGRLLVSAIGTDPASGSGLEMLYHTSLNKGYILAFDRTGAVYRDLQLEGLNLILNKDSSGNVGVATLTPAAKFHVVGDSRFGDQATNYIAISATGVIEPHGSGTYHANGGNAGLSNTYTFGGGGTGDIATMTFEDGLLTSVTTVP